MSDNSLVPVEQRIVEFYEDEVIAVRLDDGSVLVPVRPIIEGLGIDWASQTRRIGRDPILAEESRVCVVVTTTQGLPDQRRDMLCLPLDYLSGFLFGISANRVKPELRERVIRYQRECYKVLAEAFTDGRLTPNPDFDALLAQDTPEAQAVYMARAMLRLANNQLIMRGQLDDHENRLESLEAVLSDPGRYITDDQASQISQAVKTVAMVLSKASGTNQYGSVYGELYRKFGITSYKQLPAARFDEAMAFLTEWHQGLVGEEQF
jgi:hypothetical protein